MADADADVVAALDVLRGPFSFGACIAEFCAAVLETDAGERAARIESALAYGRKHLLAHDVELPSPAAVDESEPAGTTAAARGKRRCDTCGKTKGSRAFRIWSDTCVKCERAAAGDGDGAPASAAKRKCDQCGDWKGLQAFRSGGRVCRKCLKAREGRSPADKFTTKRGRVATKTCRTCGQEKGVTGFRRGSDECTKCAKANEADADAG